MITDEQRHVVTRRGHSITYAECTCGWTSGPSYSIDAAHIAGMSHRVEAYRAERDALARRIEAVRALHTQDDHGPGRCDDPACEAWCREDSMDWPCPTTRALDGEDGA